MGHSVNYILDLSIIYYAILKTARGITPRAVWLVSLCI